MKEVAIKKYLTLAGVQDEFHRSAYPIPGYDLRAPVVWYVLPSL